MKRFLMAAAMAALVCAAPVSAGTKTFTTEEFKLPADKPVTIVLMRPDVQVGTLTTGGLVEVNADWTDQARGHIREALEANQQKRGAELRVLDESNGEAAQLVGDYEALHRAVAGAILAHKYNYGGGKLPTKKGEFDWTLGEGAQRLGELSGGNYALFLHSRDHFASAGRKAFQVAGLLGCVIGVCIIASGGQHVAYASLVELSTGKVVWFNVLRGSKGDVREASGAAGMVDALMTTMPTKPGQSPSPAAGTKRPTAR